MEGKKIMVCDDDVSIVEMLELILGFTGAKISTETDSVKLFDRLQAERPDLLIIDIWMPILTGDLIVKRVRATESSIRNMPIIIISASRDGREIAEAAGATSYLPKPFDIDELTSAAERLLNY
ncbi:response regulator [Mucilaginibacter sp. CSA2-8R]|uniref:response regulator n=1 Tax=Mucilaginibacter sp. CSA2-8R TaxID=3141542 RepID=UPI00315C9309